MHHGSAGPMRSRSRKEILLNLLLIPCGIVAFAACHERPILPSDAPARDIDTDISLRGQSVVLDSTPTSCGAGCLLVPGDVPGTFTRTLNTGPNSYTAEHSVVWPDTLSNAAVMLMRVKGTIPRAYVGAMTPSFAHVQGTAYKSIDADGAFSGSYCYGEIRTNFRVFGFEEYTLRSCTLSSNNNDADNLIVAEKSVVGRLKGSGSIIRTGMNQPSWPGWYNCLNGPCILAGQAEQTITMYPWMDRLRLSASPAEVYEGDSVTFTSTVSGGMVMIAGSQRWKWVPHNREVGGSVQATTTDAQTGVCANGTAVCKVRVFKTGNMYLKANLNPTTVSEQAFAKVVVKPLALIATPTPKAVDGSLDSVKVLVRTVPHRTLTSITISPGTGAPAFRIGRVTNSFASTCDPTSGECELSGGTAPQTLTVTATTLEGVTLTSTVTVDQLPCPTGNAVLDSKEMRSLIDSVWKVGGNQGSSSSRRERGAMLIDSAGVLIAKYLPLDVNSTPCTTTWPTFDITQFIPPRWIVGAMTIVSVIHTHPFQNLDTLPANCPANFAGQKAGNGPSYPDWDNLWRDQNTLNNSYKNDTGLDLFSPYFQPVVVDPDHLWLIDPESTRPWGPITAGGKTYQMPDTVIVGNNIQAWQRSKPLNSTSCVSKVNLTPTLLK